jgi:hypothetical protein
MCKELTNNSAPEDTCRKNGKTILIESMKSMADNMDLRTSNRKNMRMTGMQNKVAKLFKTGRSIFVMEG